MVFVVLKKRVKPLRTWRKKKKKLCALSGLCGFKKKGLNHLGNQRHEGKRIKNFVLLVVFVVLKKRVKPLRTRRARRKKNKKLCAFSGLCGFKKGLNH